MSIRNGLIVLVATFLVGLGLTWQVRVPDRPPSVSLVRPVEPARSLTTLLEANAELAGQVATLQGQLATYRSAEPRNETALLVEDLNRLKLVNGQIAATGPGIEVRIADWIGEAELQDLINELRNSGAEALALNDRRLLFNATIAAGREGMVVNGETLRPPFVIQAIGNPEELARGLERKGGVLQLIRLSYPTVSIVLMQRDRLTVPVYKGTMRFQFAQVVE
jgi:uncharacterized protein YlxW (UPF0749 family)